MERVHKANLLVILACVLTMSATTVMSYGMSTRTIKGCGVLWATLIIVMIVQFLQVSDFVKAMVIVLCPSYAVLIYSGLVNGNSIAFLANFITLCMAVRYFDKKIIKYYAIPFTATCVACLFINVKIIDGAFVGAISKICLFAISAVLLYLGTKFGEKKTRQAEAALCQVQENTAVANRIAFNLNREIVECGTQVEEVTSHAQSVKTSAEQMEQVVDESSRAIQTVSEKLNTAKEQIDKNYDYAQQLEQSFAEVTQAVNDGNKEAKTVQKSMLEMSETVGQASDATAGLLEQMNTITGILNDINAIAGQTNLLSLNASIEAARAGEHGKGFAVVADQIRVLSEDSRKSADSIKEIILTLTETVNGVVDKISAGADAAKNSSVQIEDLIGKLDTVNNFAESATVVVKEEYDVIGEVKRQFDDIQEELDTVAATSEENASMVAEIGNNIVNQTDYVMKLSDSIGSLKESSKKLEEHFNE